MKYLILAVIFTIIPCRVVAQEDTTSINKRMLTAAIVSESVVYTGMITGLQYLWYKDVPRVAFHYYNDNAGYLQIDKLGHAYGAFVESHLCYEWLRKAGVSRNKSLVYGGLMGLVLQTPIEIFDGIYEGWGFSWGDMAANAFGSGLLIGQEYFFDEQIVDFKFSFRRSEFADASNGMLGDNYLESLFYDYNGHTYWLSFSPVRANSKIPPFLQLSLGYSADGMYGEFENRRLWKSAVLPIVERRRQFFLSLDVDWTKIKTDRVFLKKLFFVLNHIKLPFPALEYNTLGEWKLHAFYF